MDRQDSRGIGADIRFGIGFLVIAAACVAVYIATRPPPDSLIEPGVRDGLHSIAGMASLVAVIAGLVYLLRGLFARPPRG